jgi:hypothetical protein
MEGSTENPTHDDEAVMNGAPETRVEDPGLKPVRNLAGIRGVETPRSLPNNFVYPGDLFG